MPFNIQFKQSLWEELRKVHFEWKAIKRTKENMVQGKQTLTRKEITA
jgi:hypothetical protein